MKNIICFLLAAMCVIAACRKTGNDTPSRLFRPILAGQLTVDSNTITVAWQKIAGATSYVLQVSRDTFSTVMLTMETDTNVVEVKKLQFNQLYQLQVKAIAADTALNSKWSFLGAIKTLSSILKVPAIDDITTSSVRVRWTTKGAAVTAIKIIKTQDSSVVAQENLSAADVTNEFRIINGLQAETKYTILLYSDADVRGYVDFTTKAPFAGTVIDLTGFTGRPSVLADTLGIIPSGSTVLLKRGETYNIASAISLNKTLIIMSAPDLTTTAQAKIFFTSNFNFAAGATIDSLEFNDVHMYSDNYGSRYVFNTTNSASVGKIKFMNSRVEIFRGVLRLQSGTTTVNHFIIHNSIVDSIAGFGILTVGAAGCKAENISFTNSTVYKAEKIISSVQNSTSILIDACTFNEAPMGNNSYYIDYGTSPTNTIANGITLTSCIFGPGKNSAGAFSVRGLRAANGTTLTVGNNYRTSDFVSGGSDFPAVNPYNRTAVQLWKDPANGNFTIQDITFPGKNSAGDPRWR